MCLTPDITSCTNVPDGTKIIYQTAVSNDCNHPHMLFVHLNDGTLIHHCSQKKVCPRDGHIILSSDCDPAESVYARTEV